MLKYVFWILALLLIIAGVLTFILKGTPLPVANNTVKEEAAPIKVTEPTSGSVISSPLHISGEAPGNWFFEAVMPVKLVDSTGKVLAQGPATAQGEWMTTNFVPFTAELTFTPPTVDTGYLIFAKDNPSGMAELDQEYKVGVRFR